MEEINVRNIISLILALTLCFSLASGLVAHADGTSDDAKPGFSTPDPGPMRPEETEWVTRTTDEGWIQIRLWSITYGYWKTDWITVGHI